MFLSHAFSVANNFDRPMVQAAVGGITGQMLGGQTAETLSLALPSGVGITAATIVVVLSPV